MKEIRPLAIAAIAGASAGALAYALIIRPWHLGWGATGRERSMPLPGDEIVIRPNMESTRAITIDAPPSDVWPWLVQMGKGRGGLYSYDWLDIAFGFLDEPSAEAILPEHQALRAGDAIPMGCDETQADDFVVHAVDPERALVIGAWAPEFRDKVSWSMVLYPLGTRRTRLIVRVRGSLPMDAQGILTYALLEPATFVMLRKQMLNLKRLAERTRKRREITALAQAASSSNSPFEPTARRQ